MLPFVNASADPNTEYLSDGVTENLINSFSQLPKLRVIPRSRVFLYKGKETDPEKIGRELNVRAVLTGRVTQRGDSLNIQTELVDVAADSQLWGQQYNRKFSEIITVQEEAGHPWPPTDTTLLADWRTSPAAPETNVRAHTY